MRANTLTISIKFLIQIFVSKGKTGFIRAFDPQRQVDKKLMDYLQS